MTFILKTENSDNALFVYCRDRGGCADCEIGKIVKDRGFCNVWVHNHPLEAAKIMGAEIAEDKL